MSFFSSRLVSRVGTSAHLGTRVSPYDMTCVTYTKDGGTEVDVLTDRDTTKILTPQSNSDGGSGMIYSSTGYTLRSTTYLWRWRATGSTKRPETEGTEKGRLEFLRGTFTGHRNFVWLQGTSTLSEKREDGGSVWQESFRETISTNLSSLVTTNNGSSLVERIPVGVTTRRKETRCER